MQLCGLPTTPSRAFLIREMSACFDMLSCSYLQVGKIIVRFSDECHKPLLHNTL